MIEVADRSTLVDDTADRIRRMIFSGQLKPGQLLPSRKEMAAQYGVGMATIHEAVKSLDAVGLVESRPGKGTWVSQSALDSVIHPSMIRNRFGTIDARAVYEARFMLEVSLAELAAEKGHRRRDPGDGRRVRCSARVSSTTTTNLRVSTGIST